MPPRGGKAGASAIEVPTHPGLIRALTSPSPSAGGERVQAFLETYPRQSRGRWAGRPIDVQRYQGDFLHEAFRTDHDGRRIYNEALWGLARKNGKSTIAAGLGLYLLVGDNEPGPEVYAAAASRQQAQIVFDEARRMVEASPVLSDHLVVRRHHIEYPDVQGVFRVLAADAPRTHGLNASGVVIDELHAHRNPELYYALTTGSLAREQPLTISITTAGYDRKTICWDVFQRGLEGEPGLLFWWLGASEESDWSDPALWKACNPAPWITPEDLEREWNRLPPAVFARLHLNTWTAAEELWLPIGAWASCRGTLEIADGAEVWIGVDIGLRHDTSAIAIVAKVGDKFHVRVEIFEPPSDGSKLNLVQIEQRLLALAQRYTIREVAYDPYFFQRSAMELEDRLPMVEFPQHNARMVPASQLMYDLVAERRIVHDGDVEFARHVQGAAVRETERGWRIAKARSEARIDALVAAVMAVDRAAENETFEPLVAFRPR